MVNDIITFFNMFMSVNTTCGIVILIENTDSCFNMVTGVLVIPSKIGNNIITFFNVFMLVNTTFVNAVTLSF